MKKLLLFLILIVIVFFVKAQEVNSKVALILKNGHVVKGVLVEKNENKYIKIKGKDGGVTEYNYDVVKKIEYDTTKIKERHNSISFYYGINSSGVSTKLIDKSNLQRSINFFPGKVGFAFNCRIKNYLSFQTELSYVREGYNVKYTVDNEPLKDSVKLDYLTIPVSLFFKTGGNIKFNGFIGGYFSVLLRSKTDWFYDVKYQVYDCGAFVGVGVEFPLSQKVNMFVQTRYKQGLCYIDKWNLNQMNNSIEALVGVTYFFNDKY